MKTSLRAPRAATGPGSTKVAGFLAALLALLLALLLSACFETSTSTGGSETTNGLSGLLRDDAGAPAARVAVTLVPERYNPVPGKDETRLRRTTTDAAGRYRFAEVEAGTYNLEARDAARDLRLLLRGLRIERDGDTLAADGSLAEEGEVEIPFADRRLPPGAIAYLPGTTWQAPAAGDGRSLVLAGLPPGPIAEVRIGFASAAEDLPYPLAEDLMVRPGERTVLPPAAGWAHRKALRLDAAGLPGRESLRGYPVLLRLHAGNFDFASALPGGADLRVLGPGGRLPHQVEHWDPEAKSAAVWVRVDSLPGGAGDTSLSLLWGRPDAVDLSSGPAVFDSAAGFSSVWHLAEAPNAAPSGYRDAAGENHATATATEPGSRVAAAAGYGRAFGPAGSVQAALPRGLGGNGSFTASFWLRFEPAAVRQWALRFGGGDRFTGIHFLIRPDSTAQFGPFDMTGDDSPSAAQNHFSLSAHAGAWVHVGMAYDAASGLLSSYVNGAKVAENPTGPLDLRGGALRLGGGEPGEAGLSGGLDEVRILDRAAGADRMAADYLTQKEGAAVLTLP